MKDFFMVFSLALIINIMIKIATYGVGSFMRSFINNMLNTCVTLNEFLNERGNFVKQVVYKVDGDFVGDIKGDNVTVILMGDGDFVGDIDSPNGEVVLIKGSIDGDVKANKIVCPEKPTEQKHKATCESCLYYADINQHHYWCTQGRCMGRHSKNILDI